MAVVMVGLGFLFAIEFDLYLCSQSLIVSLADRAIVSLANEFFLPNFPCL